MSTLLVLALLAADPVQSVPNSALLTTTHKLTEKDKLTLRQCGFFFKESQDANQTLVKWSLKKKPDIDRFARYMNQSNEIWSFAYLYRSKTDNYTLKNSFKIKKISVVALISRSDLISHARTLGFEPDTIEYGNPLAVSMTIPKTWTIETLQEKLDLLRHQEITRYISPFF